MKNHEDLIRSDLRSLVLEHGHPQMSVDQAKTLIGDMARQFLRVYETAEKEAIEREKAMHQPTEMRGED